MENIVNKGNEKGMKMKTKHNRLLVFLMAALVLVQQSNVTAFAGEISEVQETGSEIGVETSKNSEIGAETNENSEIGTETSENQEEESKTEASDIAAKQDFTYSQTGMEVSLHLSSPVAENAEVSLTELDPDDFENEAFTKWIGEKTVVGAKIYKIHLADASGNNIETGKVNFKMNLSEIAVPEAESGVDTRLSFLHIKDDGTVEEGSVSEEGNTAEITANGLSTFVFVRTVSSSKEKEKGILSIGEVEGNTFYVDSEEALQSALTSISEGEGSYTIHLKDDITLSSSINIEKNTVTIIGDGHTINFTKVEVPIRIDGGTSGTPVLILGDSEDSGNKLVLNGDGVAKDGGHLIVVAGIGNAIGNGTVKIYGDTTIQNSVSNNAFGGAIAVGQGGYLEMNGGLITNCGINGGSVNFGGGVAVINGGHFTMNGGFISDCYASTSYDTGWQVPAGAGGAVFVGQGSTFTMNGGSLSNNRASADGGAVALIASKDSYTDHGGWGFLDSRFEMNGGTISGNTAGHVGGGLAALGTCIDAYGLCTATLAAGRPENPGVYINAGTISGNSAHEGGGIFLNWIRSSIPVQIHNATINGNTAVSGAGIEVMSYWTQADIDGCTISGNQSTDGKGAGIYLKGNGSGNGTTLKNTTITNNTSTELGAGVYYDANSKLTISGANTIQNNNYNGTINNLNILDKDHPVYVNGSLAGSSIGLSDPTLWSDDLADKDSSAVSTAKLTSGFNEYNADIKPEEVFTSDHNTWVPDYGEKKEDTTSFGYDTTAASWSDIKVKDTVWVVPSIEEYSGSKTLYYNPNTKVYSISSSGSYPVAMILKDNTYYLAYKNRTSYYILKTFSGEPEMRSYILPGREMTYGHFPSDLSLDGYSYYRVNDFSTSSTKDISCYELIKISNGDGYDYTNEVRLVRGYAIKYMDGESEANFDSIEHPTTYSNKELTLVNPAEKTGYKFVGWYRDAAFSDGPITKLSADELIDDNGNIVLYAKWVQDISSEGIVIGDLENLVYNGKNQEQIPSVKTKDGTDLTASDYTVSYSEDTKNVGTVTVTITGKGNYTGSVTRTYDITKKELTVKTESAEKKYDGKPLTAEGSIDGFVEGESAELKLTGTQTDVGRSSNTYTIEWNDVTKESNYEVKETVGTLTVKEQDKKDNTTQKDNKNDNKNDTQDGNKTQNDNKKSPQNNKNTQNTAGTNTSKANVTNTSKANATNAAKTGDESNIFLWLALLLVSGGAVTATSFVGKKRKNKR